MYAFNCTRWLILQFVLLYQIYYITALKVDNTIKEVDEIFDEVEKGHNRLRTLFQSVLAKLSPPMVPVEDHKELDSKNECICVPVYLCDDKGYINRDGLRFELRTNDEESTIICQDPLEVCCKDQKKVPIPESTCGYSSGIVQNDIRKDEGSSLFGEFAWTAVLIDDEYKYVCAGTLIHPRVILTAAHCINHTSNYTVKVGRWDTSGNKQPLPSQSQQVQIIIKHHMFNPINVQYDAAILVVPEPFVLLDNVKIACISQYVDFNVRSSYNECVATGWGIDKFTDRHRNIMKRMEVSLVQHKVCEEQYRTATHVGKWFDLHRSFICASGHNGYDVCTGDGGGPLVCPIPGTHNRYELVGITSWGIGCGENTPSVFVRVSEIKHWIDGWFERLKFSKDYEYESTKLLF